MDVCMYTQYLHHRSCYQTDSYHSNLNSDKRLVTFHFQLSLIFQGGPPANHTQAQF